MSRFGRISRRGRDRFELTVAWGVTIIAIALTLFPQDRHLPSHEPLAKARFLLSTQIAHRARTRTPHFARHLA